MGAQASKQVIRKLPKEARPETRQSAPRESPSTVGYVRQEQKQQQQHSTVDKVKDDLLGDLGEQETSDPQLLENLAKLGPVTVQPTVTRMQQSDAMLGILHERQRIEQDEELGHNNNTRTTNRLTTDELFSILEHRKHLPPNALEQQPGKWEELSKECGGMDVSSLKTLFKYYNTITVMPPANPEDKSERRQGLWVRDKVEWKHLVDETNRRHELERKAKENQHKDVEHKADQSLSQEERRERHLKDLFVD